MTPLRAFVSSTLLDLRDHRSHVIAALRKGGLVVDPMEEWPADGREPRVLSVGLVDSELFVLIVARRRGYIPPGSELSITQQEYRAARAKGLDTLVFLLDDAAPWHREYDELDSDPGVAEWRRELARDHACSSFGLDPRSIDVTAALARWLQGREAPAREVEYKLTSLANAQFKFNTLEPASQVLNRLRALCDLIGIGCSFGPTRTVVDEYFDDAVGTLQRGGCSLRLRTEGSRHFVTCKAKRSVSTSGAVERFEDEREIDPAEMVALRDSGFRAAIQEVFRDRFGVFVDPGPVALILAVHDSRTTAKLQTRLADYRFSHDKYYFRHGDDFSEYFVELELEVEREPRNRDTDCEKLVRALSDVLGYQHGGDSAKSKYERGVRWARSKMRDAVPVHCVAFRLIDFVSHGPSQQKQLIQALNHHLKGCFYRVGIDPARVVYLPMGSGMMVLLEAEADALLAQIVEVCFALHDDLRGGATAAVHEGAPRGGPRVSILVHTGRAFKYSDLQEHLNYAGDGIEAVQRQIEVGQEWHLLMTPAAHVRFASGGVPDGVVTCRVSSADQVFFNVYEPDRARGNASWEGTRVSRAHEHQP
jgi:hypothetical protein